MKTNGALTEMMREFLTGIDLEKKAAEEVEEIKQSSGEAQTEEVKMPDGQGQGEPGNEKTQDVNAGIAATPAQSAEAENKDGDSDKPTDDQGPNTLDASEAVSQETVTVVEQDSQEKNKELNDKKAFARHTLLANRIMQELMAMQEKEASEKAEEEKVEVKEDVKEESSKEITEEVKEDTQEKEASEKHNEEVEAFKKGVEKKASDVEELVKAGFTKEMAEAVLNKIAMETPAAVMPEEEMPEEVADEINADAAMQDEASKMMEQLPEEEKAQLIEIANALEEQGVTPDDIMMAAQEMENMQSAGVTPEEMMAAISEIADEESAAPVEEAAPVVEEEMSAEDMEKLSAERKGVIKGYIKNLMTNK